MWWWWAPLLGATAEHPLDYLDRELKQLRRDSASSPRPALLEIVAWLERRRASVPCERLAVLHRDYHPWNVLVDPGDTLWVLDWDWQVGDARFDLAWAGTLLRRSGFDELADAVRSEYERQTGHPLDGLPYVEVLTTTRWLVNVLRALDADTPARTAAQAAFRAFLGEPVRRARAFLRAETGIDADLRP